MSIRYYNIYLFVIIVFVCSACANRGAGPQGGPRDTIPPVVQKEVPLNGSLHFNAKRIEVHFDEYIQLADVQKNVLISPPQQNPPEVKAIGKTLSIFFQEDLIDSTTYTIDCGAAICDYNEKIPLMGYVYSFSTGDVIDSLAISGRVYDAENLNPISEVLVGIHRDHADSALNTLPFVRITRSDQDGYFTIHNMRAGAYRLYALNDISRDYIYQPGEAMAFADSLVYPRVEIREEQDTLWQDTIGLDELTKDTLFTRQIESISTIKKNYYLPDTLVLWYFTESKQRHYFKGVYREEQHAFNLLFSAPQDSLPIIRALKPSENDSSASDSSWVNWMDYTLMQTNATNDTITYWLIDSLAIVQDSIYLEMIYTVTDSVYNLVQQIDTVLAVYRRPRMSDKAWETQQRKKQERKLELKTNASSKFEIYDTLVISSFFPIDSMNETKIHLSQKIDSLVQPVQMRIMSCDSLKQKLYLIAKLEPSQSYFLTIDSAALFDIYGKCNDSIGTALKLKSLEDYSTLSVKLTHFDARARLQVLNEKDEVIRELPALEGGSKFEYLTPTTYYLRMYIDYNGDNRWTTGDWQQKRQPEPVYYFPSKLKLRANWEFEENFDHLAVPQIESKPKNLIGKAKKK